MITLLHFVLTESTTVRQAWKKRMERVFSTVSSDVVFVIGGSLGLAIK